MEWGTEGFGFSVGVGTCGTCGIVVGAEVAAVGTCGIVVGAEVAVVGVERRFVSAVNALMISA
jgi:hypothetical protein